MGDSTTHPLLSKISKIFCYIKDAQLLQKASGNPHNTLGEQCSYLILQIREVTSRTHTEVRALNPVLFPSNETLSLSVWGGANMGGT